MKRTDYRDEDLSSYDEIESTNHFYLIVYMIDYDHYLSCCFFKQRSHLQLREKLPKKTKFNSPDTNEKNTQRLNFDKKNHILH